MRDLGGTLPDILASSGLIAFVMYSGWQLGMQKVLLLGWTSVGLLLGGTAGLAFSQTLLPQLGLWVIGAITLLVLFSSDFRSQLRKLPHGKQTVGGCS
jgi:hypothetical protein